MSFRFADATCCKAHSSLLSTFRQVRQLCNLFFNLKYFTLYINCSLAGLAELAGLAGLAGLARLAGLAGCVLFFILVSNAFFSR